MIAVDDLDFEGVRSLLARGEDINAADEVDQRALHFAVDIEVDEAQRKAEKTGSKVEPRGDMTQMLLEHGADPSVRTSRGESPLDWAMARRHGFAEQLLRQYGAG
jgi:ankyrin repeat protein